MSSPSMLHSGTRAWQSQLQTARAVAGVAPRRRLRPAMPPSPLRVVCMARPWRPHVDDVDRLSRGEGAKARGTGCRDIPHRLNAQEREVYRAAKKKGFLAVRGTGYRRERRGNPLPNVFRQWCDAKAAPCVVIEQDMLGGPLDQLVVDLTPLRLLDTATARQQCADIAASMGVRCIGRDGRDAAMVPFNVLPLVLPGSGARAAQGTSSGTPRNAPKARQQLAQAVHKTAGPALREDPPDDCPAPAPALGGREQELELRAAELHQQLERQRAAVRAIKEEGGGRGNADPEVQAQVQELLRLKAAAAAAADDVTTARAQAIITRQQATSARRASIFDAFAAADEASCGSSGSHMTAAPESGSGSGSGSVAEPQEGEVHVVGSIAQPALEHGLEERLRSGSGSGSGSTETRQGGASMGEEAGSEGPPSGSAGSTPHAQRGRTPEGLLASGSDDDHPFFKAAIWQLPADPLFFEADRSTAKLFAKEVVERLCLREVAHWL